MALKARPQVRKVPKSILRPRPRMSSSTRPGFGSMFSHIVSVWSWGSSETIPNFRLVIHTGNLITISTSQFFSVVGSMACKKSK